MRWKEDAAQYIGLAVEVKVELRSKLFTNKCLFWLSKIHSHVYFVVVLEAGNFREKQAKGKLNPEEEVRILRRQVEVIESWGLTCTFFKKVRYKFSSPEASVSRIMWFVMMYLILVYTSGSRPFCWLLQWIAVMDLLVTSWIGMCLLIWAWCNTVARSLLLMMLYCDFCCF
jgi:hypothetical protein